LAALAADVDLSGLDVDDRTIPGPEGAPDVTVRVYVPRAPASPAIPAILYIHGGGFFVGSIDTEHMGSAGLARELGVVVVSVEYRLAPEFPEPAPFEDAYAALEWLAAHAAEIGAESERIAIGGDSAGGGLAASVALHARDNDGPAIAHQLLVYPAVAEIEGTDSYRVYGEGHFLTAERIAFYWKCYVPRPELAELTTVCAACAESLRGLPPATIVLAECDPLYDIGVAYAERLRADGVPVELRVYDGQIHAFFSFIGLFARGREAVIEAGKAVGAAFAREPVPSAD
ncbi:MAG: alpha/beta hydrolase, partial [Candidatus Eremiobacteraeota bacterium]|nr:alpha/beta hydrolase [Candidatus Eremiobacteraeota bacterium]